MSFHQSFLLVEKRNGAFYDSEMLLLKIICLTRYVFTEMERITGNPRIYYYMFISLYMLLDTLITFSKSQCVDYLGLARGLQISLSL